MRAAITRLAPPDQRRCDLAAALGGSVLPGTEPLALRVGRTYAVPLAPGGKAGGEHFPVNRRWRVYEDPAVVGTALELK